MDSRFYNKNNAKYPLYPQNTKWFEILIKIFITKNKYRIIKEKLNKIISESINVDRKEIYYFSSASKALEETLKILKKSKNIKRVYIPDFSCMELADAIYKSNCELKVYDIEENLKANIETIKQIGTDLKAVLILPSLFGKNTYSKDFLKTLANLTIPVILDEAQSFPNISMKLHTTIKKYATIISFGKSKPIAGIGGGAIINKNLISSNWSKQLIRDIKEDSYITNILRETNVRINNIFKKYSIASKDNKKMYKSLEDLVLDKKDVNDETDNITKLQIIVTYYNMKKYKKTYLKKKMDTHIHVELFGDKLIKDYNFLPLKVNNTKRYTIMKLLADKGIQSTIYYYPLHLIPYYTKKSDLILCESSKQIFKDIIIIPFRIYYSNRKLNKIVNIINRLKKEEKL